MSVWRRSLRGTLILCVLGVGAAVVIGLRDRAEPARALVVERSDPDAVIQTRGSRVVQADALGENLRVVADRQDTYQDGGLRLVDNVQVTVATREDRPGFVLTGNEATLDAGKTAVELTGTVEMASSDGLSASTGHASYTDRDGVVRMPGPTTFRRDGLDATGDGAEYDREDDVLRLLDNAHVDLISDTTRTRITSWAATLAQTDGYMEFSDDVIIETDSQRMMSGRARAVLKGEGTTVETLDLTRNARIVGTDPQPGTLREMTARTIGITYDETGTALDAAVLTGGSHLEIAATDGAPGSTIRSRSMRLAFDDDGSSLAELVARNEVELVLPASQDATTQTVTSNLLTVTGQSGAGLERARFDGAVAFREISIDDDGALVTNVTSADRLEATLANGMTQFEETRFLGDVTFANGDVVGVSDQATYAIEEGRVELMLGDSTGRAPRVEDGRGSVQANLIALDVKEGQITAEGEVESVLLTDPTDADTEHGTRRPGLLEPSEPTYVTAGHLVYGGATDVAVYSQGARLWQAATEFVADRITLDETNGNISAEGAVRTRSLMSQINDETGLQEESISTGTAAEFVYDETLHRALYTTDAQLTGPRADLAADEISVFLKADSRTLERIEATGEVVLSMPGRSVTGESLVYYDAGGRYEMEGGPVQIIEEVDTRCRKTTGRTLTFFLTDDAVSVDGESQVRTETLRGTCPELTP